MTRTALKQLLEIGFEPAGECRREGQDLRIAIERYTSALNVLYAFVMGADELLYVGRSGRALAQRMAGYERGGPPRSTRTRNRERILALLDAGQRVRVYAMPDPGSLHYGAFQVNLAAALQHSVQGALDPPWNRSEPARAAPVRQAVPAPPRRARRPAAPEPDYTDLTVECPSYRFLVGYLYLSKGFFNVPLRYSRLFGADRERIRLLCGAERTTLQGRIDRQANTNATPRIVGGSALADWFESEVGLDKPVDIDILAPNAVWIRPPPRRS